MSFFARPLTSLEASGTARMMACCASTMRMCCC